MDGINTLEIPPKLRRGARQKNSDKSIDSAVWLINYMAKHLGYTDLGNTEILDMGCGDKFTQAFINHKLPVKRYVGIDVYKEMIDFLTENVSDQRFEYHHMNTHNDMYNPDGIELNNFTELPLDKQTFDIICLYSVFTHMAAHDYPVMLKLLRPYIKPGGKLLYTLYINELTEGGYGLRDAISKKMGHQNDNIDPPPFVDLDKNKPLQMAMYSRDYAIKLIENTGWKVESLSDPLHTQIQHHFVCTPI